MIFCVWLWIRLRGHKLDFKPGTIRAGILMGVVFAFEFICLFMALYLTSVTRTTVIFYSMPVWLALAGHLLLPGERLNRVGAFGLLLAMGGVALAMRDNSAGQANLLGDLLALAAALFWAAIALIMRLTPLSKVPPETQMLVVIGVSTPVLLGLAPFLGDTLRDPGPLHLAGLAFQAIFVASFGYLLWAKLISIYRAGEVASFSFLSPVFAVILGWWLLGEHISPLIWIALALVAAGVFLINRR